MVLRGETIRLQRFEGGMSMVQFNSTKTMDSAPLLYTSGEEVHLGDRVQYCANFATVVFISDGETYESAPGYEDHGGSDRGLIVCDDDGSITTMTDPDERLIFVERG
jgi:hypothetical protein